MVAYVIKRLGTGVAVLFIVSLIAFIGLSMAPGDPLTARVSPTALAELTPKQLEQKRHDLGLDQPVPVRYGKWLSGVLHGDLGYSTSDSTPVSTTLRTHVGPTLILMLTALGVAIVIAIPLGIYAAVRNRTWIDYVCATVPLVLVGVPVFVIGLIAIYLLSVKFQLLPSGGMHTFADTSVLDVIRHVILPAAVLGAALSAPLIRYTRAGMLEALRSDYVTTARSKGLSPWAVTVRHAFRNALLPVLTVVGVLISELIAGSVIVEQVFNWPGIGQLAVRAAGNRDVGVILGVVLVVGATTVVINLLTDLVYARIDPRVRLD